MNKVNKIGQKIGHTLIKSGESIVKKSFDLSPSETKSYTTRLFIESYYPKAKHISLDGTFNVITWDKWLELIEWEMTDLRTYIKEKFDCDDFSYVFKYNILRIFGIPCHIVHGHMYKDNKWIGGHFWNAMVSDGKLYFYEPISDKWTQVEKGKPAFINGKEYRPLTFEF